MTDEPRDGQKRRLSMDDIEQMLSDIASDRSDPVNQMRAIKALTGIKTQEAVLPDPLDDAEIKIRLARLNCGAGLTIAQLAYLEAFKHSRQSKNLAAQLQAMRRADAGIPTGGYPKTVNAFYKRYPELKANKVPKGYPRTASLIARERWLRTECDKIELERARDAINAAVADIEGKDAEPTQGVPEQLAERQETDP